MTTPIFTHESYTTGWVCALPIEMAAATAMLDETHPSLQQPPTDTNNYVLGRIHTHNTVIACLPSGVYGTTSAAIVAKQMTTTFPRIRIGLMVGIAGGVPQASKEKDIRLGDVVVSLPNGQSGGVIAYDYGKTVENGTFTRTGSLAHPPLAILTAIGSLRSSHLLGGGRMREFLHQLVTQYPDFASPGPDRDILFDSTTITSESPTTEPAIVDRPPRPNTTPGSQVHIHYGTIASGDRLIKHGQTRDRLAREYDVLCFEMEAAGLMRDFPCVVIRGISDYADEFKTKEWQPYAAATAAAYAKDLLHVIPSSNAEQTITSTQDRLRPVVTPLPLAVLHQIFPVEPNFLGSLTTDALWPRQNFHALPTPASPSQYLFVFQATPHAIHLKKESVREQSSFLANWLSPADHNGPLRDDAIEVEVDWSSSCMLKNSSEWFETMSRRRDAQQWIEKQLMREKEKIYLVVGFKSLRHKDICVRHGRQESLSERDPFLDSVVYAVQYRRIKFNWLHRKDIDAATLQRGNCWQSMYVVRGDEEYDMDDTDDDMEDYLQVTLDDGTLEASIVEDDAASMLR